MSYHALQRMKVGHDEENDRPIFAEFGEEVNVKGWNQFTLLNYQRAGVLEKRPEPVIVQTRTPPTKPERNHRAQSSQ